MVAFVRATPKARPLPMTTTLNIPRIDCASDDAREAIARLRRQLSPRGDVVSPRGREKTIAVFGEPLTPAQVVERICADVQCRGLDALLEYSASIDGADLDAGRDDLHRGGMQRRDGPAARDADRRLVELAEAIRIEVRRPAVADADRDIAHIGDDDTRADMRRDVDLDAEDDRARGLGGGGLDRRAFDRRGRRSPARADRLR